MADGDECQGFNEPSRIIREALERQPGKYLHFDATMPVRGHGAASTRQFRHWYGKCLLEFLDPDTEPATKQTSCAHPANPPRFLLDAGYQFPVAPSTAALAQAKLVGAWGGTYASATSNVDRDREICIAIESANSQQASAVAAFGAGPERKSSMNTIKLNLAVNGSDFVYTGNQNYRLTLTPAGDDQMRLSITSVDGKNTFTGVLKRGC